MARRAARVLGWSLIGLIGLLGCALLAAEIGLRFGPVRASLARRVAALASDALDAELTIGSLEAVSLAGYVRARDVRLSDRAGKPLATLARVRARIDPSALLQQRVRLVRVVVEQPRVELGSPDEPRDRSGLLGLFRETAGAEPPEPKDAGDGWSVALDDVRIERGRVSARLSGQVWSADDLRAHGALDGGDALALQLHALRARVTRDGRELGEVRRARGRLGVDGRAAAEALVARGAAVLATSATLGAEHGQAPRALALTAHARGVSAETLAAFGVQVEALTAPVDLELQASGTTAVLHYRARLDTPGGSLAAAGRLARTQAITVRLQTERLVPARFLRGGLAPLAGRLALRAEPAPAFPDADVHVEVEDARYDGTALPQTTLDAHLRPAQGVTLERVLARYPGAELRAQGNVGKDGSLAIEAELQSASLSGVPPVHALAPALDGALRATARVERTHAGELRVRGFAHVARARLGPHGARSIEIDGRLEGSDLASARVRAQVTARALHTAGRELPYAELELDGVPSRYVARLRLGDDGLVQGWLARGVRGDTRIRARAHVADGRGAFVDARIDDAVLEPGGALSLRSLQLTYRGAYARLEGRIDPGRGDSALTARVRAPDLVRATAAWLEQPLAGQLALDARLEGPLKTPRVHVTAEYDHGALLGLREIGATLTADADLRARTLALQTQAQSRGRSLAIHAHSQLPPGPPSLDALARGEHQLVVHARDLPLHELEVWPRQPAAPEKARLSGDVTLEGSLQRFTANLDLHSKLRFRRDPTPVSIALRGKYDGDELALALDAEDPSGPLLRSQVKTKLGARGPLSPLPDPVALLRERAWRASLWIGSRRVEQWPAVRALEVHPALMPALLSAHGEIEHVPGAEPTGTLEANATWRPPGASSESPLCGLARPIRVALEARMQDGRLESALRGDFAREHTIALRTASHAPIDAWLRVAPGGVRPVDISAELRDLDFAEVPVLCEVMGGSVSGRAQVSRALSRQLTVHARLQARGLRAGKSEPVDADLSASADREWLRVAAELRAERTVVASVRGQLPLDGGGLMPTLDLDAPASARVQLHALPASTLLAAVPNARASRGTLGGQLALDGPLRSPELSGYLQLRELDLTLAALGQRFDRIDGELRLHGRTLQIERLALRDRKGRAELTGFVRLADLQHLQAELRAKAHGLPARRSGVMMARVDGDLRLRAQVAPQRTDVYLSLRRTNIELTGKSLAGVQPLDRLPDIVFVDGRKSDAQAEDQPVDGVTRLQIDAKEALWIRRSDFSARVRPQLVVEVRGDSTNIQGTVEIERGVVELLGQMFDIQRGKIEFTGGHEAAPVLELVATRRAPGGSEVTVEAHGPTTDPTLTFRVDGESVTAGDALAAATGTRVGRNGDTAVREQIGSVATGIATGVLTVGARRELGKWLPVLAVERGGEGETRVRAGVEADRLIPKFLRKVVVDAYLEGSVSTAPEADPAEASHASETAPGPEAAVLLELRFPRDLVGATQYGPGQRWSVDLSWEPQ